MKVIRYKGTKAQFYVTSYGDLRELVEWIGKNDIGWKMLRPLSKCPWNEYGIKITKNRMWFEMRWL